MPNQESVDPPAAGASPLQRSEAFQHGRTLEALDCAVRLIRAWHGMGMPRESERVSWGIYYAKAPEMAPIRAVLGADPTQPKVSV